MRVGLLCAVAAVLLVALTCPAHAQVVRSYYVAPAPVVAAPVVHYYPPPVPVVSYYPAPAPVVSYYPAPVVRYAAPAPVVPYPAPYAVTYRYGLLGRRSLTYYYP